MPSNDPNAYRIPGNPASGMAPGAAPGAPPAAPPGGEAPFPPLGGPATPGQPPVADALQGPQFDPMKQQLKANIQKLRPDQRLLLQSLMAQPEIAEMFLVLGGPEFGDMIQRGQAKARAAGLEVRPELASTPPPGIAGQPAAAPATQTGFGG